jgi:AcrR family transcriptional regulator
VQHYFRGKDEMMTFAPGMFMDRSRERSQAELAPAPPRQLVRGLLLQVLPLEETRRLENHVVLAFFAHAAVEPSIASGMRDAAEQARTLLADQLWAAGPADGVDPERAAAGPLVDGLGLQLLPMIMSTCSIGLVNSRRSPA